MRPIAPVARSRRFPSAEQRENPSPDPNPGCWKAPKNSLQHKRPAPPEMVNPDQAWFPARYRKKIRHSYPPRFPVPPPKPPSSLPARQRQREWRNDQRQTTNDRSTHHEIACDPHRTRDKREYNQGNDLPRRTSLAQENEARPNPTTTNSVSERHNAFLCRCWSRQLRQRPFPHDRESCGVATPASILHPRTQPQQYSRQMNTNATAKREAFQRLQQQPPSMFET